MSNRYFGRLNDRGDVDVLDREGGEPLTRLDADVYPVGSPVSARHEHPGGIALSVADAVRAGVEVEDSAALLETLADAADAGGDPRLARLCDAVLAGDADEVALIAALEAVADRFAREVAPQDPF
jgi:hypothetical protein